jgi:hypothetical protein
MTTWPTHGDLAAMCAGIAVVALMLGVIATLLFSRKRDPEEEEMDQEKGHGSANGIWAADATTDPPSPEALISKIEELGHKIRQHVEDTYPLPGESLPGEEKREGSDGQERHSEHFRASESLIRAIAALPFLQHDAQTVAHMCTSPSTRHWALRYLLAAALFSAIDFGNFSEFALVPPFVLQLWRMIPSANGSRARTEGKYIPNERLLDSLCVTQGLTKLTIPALWKWQRLSVSLLDPKFPRPPTSDRMPEDPPGEGALEGPSDKKGKQDEKRPFPSPVRATAKAQASSSSPAPTIRPRSTSPILKPTTTTFHNLLFAVLSHFEHPVNSPEPIIPRPGNEHEREGENNDRTDNPTTTEATTSSGKTPDSNRNDAITLSSLLEETTILGHLLVTHPVRFSFTWDNLLGNHPLTWNREEYQAYRLSLAQQEQREEAGQGPNQPEEQEAEPKPRPGSENDRPKGTKLIQAWFWQRFGGRSADGESGVERVGRSRGSWPGRGRRRKLGKEADREAEEGRKRDEQLLGPSCRPPQADEEQANTGGNDDGGGDPGVGRSTGRNVGGEEAEASSGWKGKETAQGDIREDRYHAVELALLPGLLQVGDVEGRMLAEPVMVSRGARVRVLFEILTSQSG